MATAAAADGGPAAALPERGTPRLARLIDQLAALGVAEVHVITRPAFVPALEPLVGAGARLHPCAHRRADLLAVAEIARDARGGGVAVLYGDVVSGREALAMALGGPAAGTAILASATRLPGAFPVRTPRSRVLSAGSPYHWVAAPNGFFAGLLRVGAGDEPALAEAAERLAGLLEEPLPAGWREELGRQARADGLDPLAAEEEVPALLVAALVRGGTPVSKRDVRSLPWARPPSAEPAAAEPDEDRALLDSAVKSADGFFTTFFVSPYSKYIARFAARRGLTPNQVTIFSMGVGLIAAAAFATGERWGLIAGALLLQAAFTFDCVDGQLARYTRQFSRFGAWLDSVFDRLKEYLVYAGLAIGSTRGFGVDAWPLAAGALTLQTVRHILEFSYWDVHHSALERAPQPPLEQPGDRSGPPPGSRPRREAPAGLAGRLSAATLGFSRLLDRPRGVHWAKKIAVFPIGERFAAISLTAAIWTPHTTFVVLLVWGGVAAVYSLAAHAMHSILRPSSLAGEPGSLLAFRDDGPLASACGRLLGPRLPLSAAALTALAALPLVVALAVGGAFVSHAALAPGIAAVVVLGGAARARPLGRFDWATPGMLRALEYGLLLWMAVLAHGSAVRSCFALLVVLAFHHYDAFYRLRQRGSVPPAWLSVAGGGWDGRLLLAYAALLAAVSTAGMAAAAAVLAILFVGESASGWIGAARGARPLTHAHEEDEHE